MKNKQVSVRRLGWAGAEIECNGEVIVIDYIQNTIPLVQLRSPDEPFPSASQSGNVWGALLTHLHADHADPVALHSVLRKGAPVYRPKTASGMEADLALTAYAEEKFRKTRLQFEIIGAWEQRTIGCFNVSAVPAADGFGDPQISWIIECNNKKIFHAGDTLFHGLWWRISHKFGPFDIALLPVNGAIVDFPPLQPASLLEAVMTPEQAAVAAHLLQARCVIPIHYGTLHKPPAYIETPHPTERLVSKLKEFAIDSKLLQPGEYLELE